MPATVTLTELILRSRSRADMIGSDFVDDTTEVIPWINESIRGLYDKLVGAYGEGYFSQNVEFDTEADVDSYDLVADAEIDDFYKLDGIDVIFSETHIKTLRKFNWGDRNKYLNSMAWSASSYKRIRYNLKGLSLIFRPPPAGVYTVRVWYVPAFAALTTGAETFDGINGWEKVVIAEVAKRMLDKEESDVTELNNDIARWNAEIVAIAANRDPGEEQPSLDVNEGDYDDGDSSEPW